MKRSGTRALSVVPLILAALLGTGEARAETMATDKQGSVETFWVDSRLTECVGVGPRMCMRIKRSPDADWELFYDSIAGFDYEEGYAYEVVVRVTERPDPPADASSLVYELVEVTARTPEQAEGEQTQGEQTEEGEASPGLSDDPTERAWQLESFPEGTGEVAPGAEATLEFDDGTTAGGTAGCNRWSGSYELSGSSFSFGLIRTTMMACPDEPRSRQEQAFLEALDRVESFAVDNGRLRLLDGNGEILMTLAPRPDFPLVGTRWEAISVNNGRQAVVSVDPAGTPTALFAADGTLTGSGGCNNYRATFSSGDGAIEIGPAAATRKMCPEPGVMDQEAWFFKALDTAATYGIDRDRLELRTETGALAVAFRGVAE